MAAGGRKAPPFPEFRREILRRGVAEHRRDLLDRMAAGGEDFRRAFGAELRMVLDRRRAEFAGEEPVDGGGAERQRPAQLLQPQRTVQTGAQVILRLLDFRRRD